VLRRARRLADDAPPGAGIEALTWSTPDGIAVRPLYTAADAAGLPDTGVPGARPFVRGSRAGGAVPDGWDVRTWHAGPDPREGILADLANGASSVWLAVRKLSSGIRVPSEAATSSFANEPRGLRPCGALPPPAEMTADGTISLTF